MSQLSLPDATTHIDASWVVTGGSSAHEVLQTKDGDGGYVSGGTEGDYFEVRMAALLQPESFENWRVQVQSCYSDWPVVVKPTFTVGLWEGAVEIWTEEIEHPQQLSIYHEDIITIPTGVAQMVNGYTDLRVRFVDTLSPVFVKHRISFCRLVLPDEQPTGGGPVPARSTFAVQVHNAFEPVVQGQGVWKWPS